MKRRPWAALWQRLASREVWVAYLFTYALFAGFSAWGTYANPARATHPEVWITVLLSPWGWLGGMFWLSPIPWQCGRISIQPFQWKAALWSVVFSEGWIALLTWVDISLYHHAGLFISASQSLIYNLLVTGPVMVLAGYLISRFEDADLGRNEALARARESQARLLQSQMHPHVLFNSLNGIAELIVKDPRAAEDSVRALSDLLRRLLAAAEASHITMEEEREMVEDYLALESLRLGPRMQVQWDWDQACGGFRILPLVLQPLVENAIKHGISPSKRGGILSIAVARSGADLLIDVKNTGCDIELHPERGVGIGLRNLRERLLLSYGPEATLELVSKEGWTCARVHIPRLILQL